MLIRGSAAVVWDRDDYIQGAEKQLGDKETYEEVSNDPQTLIDTFTEQWRKLKKEEICLLILYGKRP